MWIHHLILLLFAATLVLACGGNEKTIETEEGTFTVETEDGGVRISGEEEGVGEVTGLFGENAKIPDGFPKDVPVYPGSEVSDATVAGAAVLIRLRTGDDFEKVVAFYREKLAEEGWSLTPEREFSGGRVLPVEKEGRKGAAQISREADGTAIFVAIGVNSAS